MNRRKQGSKPAPPAWRNRAVLVCFALAAATLEIRLAWLQLVDADFYVELSESRQVREVVMPVHRGQFLDRWGEPLAVSAPVDSIYVNPSEMEDPALIRQLADAAGVDGDQLERDIANNSDSEFRWVKRGLAPAEAARILDLRIPGVGVRREYKRFYPAAEVTCHLLGFTDTDDVGIQGLEKVYDAQLRGVPGRKRVQRDLQGRVIADVEQIRAPRPGRDVRLSIDENLQFTAYRELKAAVLESGATWGSMVILDAETGELLAMVNQPACNPNFPSKENLEDFRNFAITDPFEPGSTLKPLVLAEALVTGYTPETTLFVPKYYEIDGKPLTSDPVERGTISVTEILVRSSNVGMATIGESLAPEAMLRAFKGFGVGESSAGAVLGHFESPGILDENYRKWWPSKKATLAYGYGLSVTALQLARAYAEIASGGWLSEIQLEAVTTVPEQRRRVLSPEVAADLMYMLEQVVASDHGTGRRAAIPNYRVAGKTGTAKILAGGEYTDDRYRAVFAGIAPASHPRFVAVVVISDPRGAAYGGGDVAAPVFSRVIGKALSLYSVAPDALEDPDALLARAEAAR